MIDRETAAKLAAAGIDPEAFEERAAIMEFDARFTRPTAERLAFEDLVRQREQQSSAK